MDLSVAASYFDTLSVQDGYSSAHLFYGQLDLYDGSNRDGGTSYRRSLSAPIITRPEREVFLIGTDRYLAGREVGDYFYGEKIRESVVLHPCDGLFTAGTAAQIITNTGVVTMPA